GFYSPHALLQAAQRDGVKIRPVCVNKSEVDCTLEPCEESKGEDRSYAIRLGFRLVNSLRQVGAEGLVRRRQAVGGTFTSLEHFLASTALMRSDLTALAAANALRVFGLQRRAAIWLAEAAPFCATLEDVESAVPWAPESSMERIEQDFASTS